MNMCFLLSLGMITLFHQLNAKTIGLKDEPLAFELLPDPEELDLNFEENPQGEPDPKNSTDLHLDEDHREEESSDENNSVLDLSENVDDQEWMADESSMMMRDMERSMWESDLWGDDFWANGDDR